MVFAGLQKLTLLDYPGFTACTVFVAGCDFACPFCQNASLIGGGVTGTQGDRLAVLSPDNTASLSPCVPVTPLDFLKTRQGLLDGVCISGGEPLQQDGLESFIDKVKELGFLVKLDTNGSNPQKLKKLIESGKIDYVAMDIKNSPEKYAQTIGLQDYDISPIEESINILLSYTKSCQTPDAGENQAASAESAAGVLPFEFRTTVVKEFHTEEDLLSIAHWISGAKLYFLQKFIDSDDVKQKGLHSYSDKEMQQLIDIVKTVLPTAELRGV